MEKSHIQTWNPWQGCIKNINKYIGNKLSEARGAAKLGQSALAESVGLSRASIVNIEKGRQAIPIHKLYVLAKFLQKDIGYFLPGMDEREVAEHEIIELTIPPRILAKLNKIPVDFLKQMIRFYDDFKEKKKR